MQNDLLTLIDLQKRDNEISDLVEKARSLEDLISQKNKKLDDIKGQLKAAKGKITAVQLEKKNLENEAQVKEALIKKHQGELNSLKSNDAYKSMLGEIETAKSALSALEDKILEKMEEMDRIQADVKKTENDVRSKENETKSEIQKLEEERKTLLSEADRKKTERESYASGVRDDLKSHYEAIRNKSDGLAIAPLDGNACGGCRMTLPPNKQGEIRAAKHLVFCDSCSRILYLPQDTSQKNQPQPQA